MNKLRAKFISIRDLLATAWPIVLISAIGFVVAYQFVEPAPPQHMTISTGSETGAYYAYAKRYAEILAAKGITLEIKTSAGSRQNLERLKKGEADIALVQGGMQEAPNGENESSDESTLRSLGSVSYEPVWVFYRNNYRLDKLHQLGDRRIAVGEEGSGIRGLALQLLDANEISANSKNLLPAAGLNAAEELQQERINAAFIVAAPEAAVVQVLLRSPGVRVMSFSQADAYAQRFPFLSKIVLPRGAVDLVRDTPPRDTVLLATTANVIVRDDLHPALVSLLLQAMSEVNGKAGFFQRAGEFPSYKDRSFQLSDEAERYFKSGPPFLQRYLPFWIAVLVERLLVLVVPIMLLLLPLLRIAPTIYNWRVRSKIFRSYGDLKFLENELRQKYDSSRHDEYLARLDRIEEEAYTRSIPLAFSDLFYTLREHQLCSQGTVSTQLWKRYPKEDMKSFLIANPKGGSGKSTLATNLAGYFARCGHRVMLGDTDRQQSAREWLAIRPNTLPTIRTWDVEKDLPARPPKDTTHVVLDTAAGLHGKTLERMLKQVDHIIVPVQPSLFDILATRHFLDALLEEKTVRKERTFVAVVGMRVDARTRAAVELERFLASYDLPFLTCLRDTQLYVQLAANGMTLFDLTASRAEKDMAQWRPIIDWVDQ